MSDQVPGAVVSAMRAGYASRAIVYLVVGGLALAAAWTGGQAEGSSGALDQLKSWPFGNALLWIIGIGLWLYALWRWICAYMDLEDRGTDGKAIVARIGQAVTGVIHAGLGITAIELALGQSSGSGGDSQAQHWTAQVLAMPLGRWIVGIVGLIVIGAGGYYAYKGWAEKFRRYLRATSTMEKLVPFAKAGLIAFGGVVALIGVFVLFAAIQSNAEQAGSFGKAFATIRQQAFGQILLGVVAVGMLCYAIYNVIEAVYRVVPKATGDDVVTLAQKAKVKAEGQLS